jgi:hypothetical protein
MTPTAIAREAPRPWLARLMSLVDTPELALWLAYLLLTPFYVWKSGRPQPADFVLLVLLALLVRNGVPRLPPQLKGASQAILAFATYAAVVNLLWGLILIDYDVQKVGAIGFASFYYFNALVFVICLLLYMRAGMRFIALSVWGSGISVLLQLVLYAWTGGAGLWREKLFFNNPNQLGYYALLTAVIVAFGYVSARLPLLLAGASLATCALLAASSLSKAALIGTAVVAVVAAVRRPLLPVLTVVMILLGMAVKDPGELIDRVTFRMEDMGQQEDDTLEGRGYSRIEMHPQYLVLGAAEVGHDRHGDFGGELHSSWATVLFSYGVVGLSLLLFFFWRALRLLRPADVLFLMPIFWYGITHQGLRFRLFWVFIGIVCVTTYHVSETQRRRHAKRSRVSVAG